MNQGLTSLEAKEILKRQGYNELPSAQPKGLGRIAIEVIKEPMFLLLMGCGSVYLLLGDYSEGVILLCWVFIIILISLYQHNKTEKSLEALRKLASPRVMVIRDGSQIRIPGREVVPGDLAILHEGDRVPADGFVVQSEYLSVDESLLTGESAPVMKNETSENQLYSGTLIVQGKALFKVTHTGLQTQFGKIGVTLKNLTPESTRLQREMKVLILRLFIGGAFISIGVIIAFYITRGALLHAILNGLAAAMALLPEEFPVVLTIFMAIGAWRLSKSNVLTRKPSAIETLGSATVLCSDKTGTITQNKMEISALFTGLQVYHKNDFESNQENIGSLLETLCYASQESSIDPMEQAIVSEFNRFVTQYKKPTFVKEYPLSKDLLAMTRVYSTENKEQLSAYCKGAPEAVFSLCQLPDNIMSMYSAHVHELAAKGFRVLAAAKGEIEQNNLPEEQQEFRFTFTGLVAFEDPIRPEVPEAIRECTNAGIKVIMITGDFPATASSIARQIGLPNPDMVLTGSDLNNMSSLEWREKMTKTNVFARIVPEQKLKIVNALKENGEIVAMTGDGVNDAPALKAADIGIAMGLKGTDVAREAASLVLLDDHFASIVKAIRAGRRIFDNLQKAMSYIIAIHIPIIGLVLLPAFFSWLPILLMPIHIVFLELIIDPVCSIAFESEREEKGIMNRPPRKANELFFGWKKIALSLFKGLLLLGIVVSVYFLSLEEGHSPDEVRAIAFSSLIVGNVFLIVTSLSDTRSFLSVLLEKNVALLTIATLAFAILWLSMNLSLLQNIFSFSFPGYNHLLIAIMAALGMLLILEFVKFGKQYWKNRSYRS